MNEIFLLEKHYKECKEKKLFGKWITFSMISSLLKKFDSKKIGTSTNNLPIHKIKFGNGKKRILIWSQMHGNESTGTKAIFDLLNFFYQFKKSLETQCILQECTLLIIPMLNPDGAKVYTRVNANNIDLNRDAVEKKSKESKLLKSVLDEFKPDFCFNLHDQRNIFGVEGTKYPASISFLAPSEDKDRSITQGRKETMNVIIAMNELLQQIIPNHIGRYTDEFYPTATGDNFQKIGHNTILIEAGHYKDDYDREEVRKFNFFAILQGIYHIAITSDFSNYKEYFKIPNNKKLFYDVIIKNKKNNLDIGYLYKDKIINNTFVSFLQKEEEGKLDNKIAHFKLTQTF